MRKNNPTKNHHAQVTLEFTFCIIIVLLLMYGCIMAFRWAGWSLVDRRVDHEDVMFNSINENWFLFADGPLKQLNPDFSTPMPMNLVFNNW